MARAAGLMPRRLSWSDSATLAHAAVLPLRAGGPFGVGLSEGDDLTARAVAYSGLAALFGLPMLLLASMLVGAPLAAPAAIALGYLATYYARAFDRPRGAEAINIAVLVGLVVWAGGVLIMGGGGSKAGLAAALLAPLFAVAPALARLVIAPRTDRASSAATRDAACLDRLAPGEAVLVVRHDGTLLAATLAAKASLRLPPNALGRDVSRRFALVDRPKLMEAIAGCRPGGETAQITLHEERAPDGGAPCLTAEISAVEAGAVSVRLSAAAPREHTPVIETVRQGTQKRGQEEAVGPFCDVGEAVDFAMRRAGPGAEARQAVVTAAVERDLRARCERQLCRRILFLMVETALKGSRPGSTLHLTARALKGVALLRLVCERGEHGAETDDDRGDALAGLRRVVEEAGGTVVADASAADARISVRLDLASGGR